MSQPLDGYGADAAAADGRSRRARQVDVAATDKRSSIIDANNDARRSVTDAHLRSEWQRPMRGSQIAPGEAFTARCATARTAIARRIP
jgi:hypothetical protein